MTFKAAQKLVYPFGVLARGQEVIATEAEYAVIASRKDWRDTWRVNRGDRVVVDVSSMRNWSRESLLDVCKLLKEQGTGIYFKKNHTRTNLLVAIRKATGADKNPFFIPKDKDMIGKVVIQEGDDKPKKITAKKSTKKTAAASEDITDVVEKSEE